MEPKTTSTRNKRAGEGLLLLFILTASACTTLEGASQRMKIASRPEGAKIIVNGKTIGTTPSFVDMPRSHRASLDLQRDGYPPIHRDLVGSYRFGDSLLSNFVWFIDGMPLASVIDILTETCWDFDKLQVIELGASIHRASTSPPLSIAVAPPQSEYELLSDELSEEVRKETRIAYPHSEVAPLDKTRDTFEKYSYDFSQKTDADNSDRLYDDLHVTNVLESRIAKKDDGVDVHADLVDVFTDERVPAFDKHIAGSLLHNAKPSFKNFMASLLGAVPNLFTFDFTSPSSNMNIKTGSTQDAYTGTSGRSDGFLAFISALGIRNTLPPHQVSSVRGVFRFVSALTFTYDRFSFNNSNALNPNALAGYNFDWYTVYGGFGIEGGLDTHLGYLYADLVPLYEINWVTGTGTNSQASTRTGSFEGMFEFGYQLFASSRVNFRIFVRGVSIPPEAFSNLIPPLIGQGAEVDSVVRSIGGISVGYYFPEDRRFFKGLLF